jgi:hypothetical protein
MDTNIEVLKEKLESLLLFKSEFQRMKFSNQSKQINDLSTILKNTNLTSFYKSVDLNGKSFGFVDNMLNQSILDIQKEIKVVETNIESQNKKE